ncbi:hypothetical protein, partial [Caballeronia arationis]|uniref:hypothetical protein n=1 Tax=Caballeronia arationis TaxID=1777142 RepID=UPI001F3ACF71
GSITAIIRWLDYADHEMDRLRRSVTEGHGFAKRAAQSTAAARGSSEGSWRHCSQERAATAGIFGEGGTHIARGCTGALPAVEVDPSVGKRQNSFRLSAHACP